MSDLFQETLPVHGVFLQSPSQSRAGSCREPGSTGTQPSPAPQPPSQTPPLSYTWVIPLKPIRIFFTVWSRRKLFFFSFEGTLHFFFPLEIGILRAFSFLLAPLWVYSSWVSIVENDCTKRQERNMLSDFFLFLPKSSPLQRSWQEVQREYENLMLPSDTCKSEVKVWVPLKCQPRSE